MPTAVVHELQRQKVSDSGGPLAVAITHDPTLGVARDEIDVENNFEHATEMADSDTQPTNDLAKRQHKSCAIGWVSYLTFAWAMPLLRVGASRPLRNDDLPDVQQTHTSRVQHNELRRNWDRQRSSRQGNGAGPHRPREGTILLRAFLASFQRRNMLSGVLLMGESSMRILQAIALGWLVGYFDDEDAESWDGWVYASIVVASGAISSFFRHHFFFVSLVTGMQLKVGTTALLYDKVLRLRLSSLGQITTGHVVNLATTDMAMLQHAASFVNYLWEAPLETLVVLYLGIREVGVSFVAGFAAVALMVPTQAAFSRMFARAQQRVANLTDERVKLTNQVVTGAWVMKMNAWEPVLEKKICSVRAKEVRVRLEATLLRAVNEAMFFVQPAVVGCLVFATYRLLGNTLAPQKVFTTLALLNITQFTMGKYFYMAVQAASMSWVSVKRTERILLMQESGHSRSPISNDHVTVGVDSPSNSGNDDTSRAQVVHAGRPNEGRRRGPPHQERATMAQSTVDSTHVTQTSDDMVTWTDRSSRAATARGGSAANQAGLVWLKAANFRWSSIDQEHKHESTRQILDVAEEDRKGQAECIVGRGHCYAEKDRNLEGPAFALRSIDLKVEPGQLIGVVGLVGSSKSSLLMALLQEMVPDEHVGVSGDYRIRADEGAKMGAFGRLAYAAQEPCIQSGTLRDNILFGTRMNQARYDAVVRDCSLVQDLGSLPSGDLTGIGDRGINLSGGQRARVGLARMAYADADVYLMDDPLSAVDPAVGRELFTRVVCGRLSGSTRILVTHQVDYLRHPAVNQVVVMHNGTITARGSFDQLETDGSLRSIGEETKKPLHDQGSYPTIDAKDSTSTESANRRRSTEDTREDDSSQIDSAPELDPSLLGEAVLPDGRRSLFLDQETKGKLSVKCKTIALSCADTSIRTTPVTPIPNIAPIVVQTITDVSRHDGIRCSPIVAPKKKHVQISVTDKELNGDHVVDVDQPDTFIDGETGLDGGHIHSFSHKDNRESDKRLHNESKEEHAGESDSENGEKRPGGHTAGCPVTRSAGDRSRLFSDASLSSTQEVEEHEELKEGNVAPAELVVTEDQETGKLKATTYWEYAREVAGFWRLLGILSSMASGQVLMMAVTVWLARWSRQTKEEQQRHIYVVVLALLAVAAVLMSLFRAVLTFFSLVKASHRLHDRMLKRIIRAPVLFFDSNPVGRILNRFTKDVHLMDDMLPMTLYDFTVCSFMVLGGIVIAFVVNPWVILSSIPATAYFTYLYYFYIKTSRELKRLEAVTRSPVYSQLSETLDSLVTIRAFRKQDRFLRQFTRRVDVNTRAYFAWVYTGRWFGLRMDMVVVMVLTASCFFSVAINEYSSAIDNGLLGAALVYVIQLGGLFQWAVRQSAEVENQMVSAERVLVYCKVPQEGSPESDLSKKPPKDWPAKGNVEISDLFVRYREDLLPVLKGVNISIEGGSRVGVVGRTGAGKSSFVAAMFRLVERDQDRGSIRIDGIDISKLGLHDLRSRMSVVPQTPFLFAGAVRLNLDPFAKQSDVEIWTALETVQMKSCIRVLPGGLDALVTEGGSNFSVGQRQLLCLARALLERSQLLIMDEATANTDQHTDVLIQDVLRTSFKGKTVITVAHRLNTVIDCDQVIVLSDGQVMEAGHPHVLLESRSSSGGRDHDLECTTGARRRSKDLSASEHITLSTMVCDTGHTNEGVLRNRARQAWLVWKTKCERNRGRAWTASTEAVMR